MLDTTPLAAVKVGVASSLAAASVAIGRVIAAASSGDAVDITGLLTGGAGVTSAGVLCLVAIRLARGELVARDVLKAEAALTKLAEDRGAEISRLLDDRAIDRDLTRELIEAIQGSKPGAQP